MKKPELPPKDYNENEYQPLIGVLNKKKNTHDETKKGEKHPYRRMVDNEEGKRYSAPIVIKGKSKSLICSVCDSYRRSHPPPPQLSA